MTGTRRDVLRLGVAAAALFAAGPLRAATAGFHFPQAQRSGSRWRGRAGAGDGPAAPEVTFLERRALVVREEGRQWIAVVGIPLSVKAGEQRVSIRDAKGARELAFTVRPKNTPRSASR